MNILMPMVLSNTLARSEERFIRVLYEIDRKTILEHIIKRLEVIPHTRFIFVVRKSDVRTYHIDDVLRLLLPESKVVIAEGDTKGSACSCLLAVEEIDNDEPLMIVGSDQIINTDLSEAVRYFLASELDGGTIVFEDVHPKLSFVRLDVNGYVVETAEKRPISKNASAGYYYFKTGRLFLDAAMQMIRKRETVNGQYYVCPVYNEMIIAGRQIGVYRMEKKDYYSLTSEKGIEEFEYYAARLRG